MRQDGAKEKLGRVNVAGRVRNGLVPDGLDGDTLKDDEKGAQDQPDGDGGEQDADGDADVGEAKHFKVKEQRGKLGGCYRVGVEELAYPHEESAFFEDLGGSGRGEGGYGLAKVVMRGPWGEEC